MARAVWNGIVLAEADETTVVDGYHYFSAETVRWEHLAESTRTSVCGWKGTARYWDVVADGSVNPAAAWSYEDPKPAARPIRGWVGFWHGVHIERNGDEDERSGWLARMRRKVAG